MDQQKRIERLEEAITEAYQCVAELADAGGLADNRAVVKLLDNLYAAAADEPQPHADLLPFVIERPAPR